MPSDRETIVGRLVDRALRPLFPNGHLYNTQIICNLIVADRITVETRRAGAPAPVDHTPRWRWSGRWWSRPIPQRRVRPW